MGAQNTTLTGQCIAMDLPLMDGLM